MHAPDLENRVTIAGYHAAYDMCWCNVNVGACYHGLKLSAVAQLNKIETLGHVIEIYNHIPYDTSILAVPL